MVAHSRKLTVSNATFYTEDLVTCELTELCTAVINVDINQKEAANNDGCAC